MWSLDDLGDEKLAGFFAGGVGDDGFVVETVARFVGAEDIFHGDSMGGCLDAGNIDFLEFVDVREDIVELALKSGAFGFGEVKPREVRDVGDVHLAGLFCC